MRRNGIIHILITFCLLSVSLFSGTQVYGQGDPAAGEELFKANCSACHKLDAPMVGPALSGVNSKYDREWLYKWINNSQGLIDSGDPQAVEASEYSPTAMQAFPLLSTDAIDNILAYIENPPVDETVVEPVADANAGGGQLDAEFFWALIALVGLLAVIALILVIMTATLVTAVQSKEQGEEFKAADVWARTIGILTNKYAATAIIVFLALGGTAKWITEARTIGLHQGYMPEQPIKFSHKLHAGTLEVDCKYCHSGTYKSKNAWIPSVNVCMNCHKAVQEGPQYGTEEIGKILAAYENNEAIEWVRIHNLPDHAYFNHAQHVVVGGLECQTCHGPVEEMEVVYQYSDLSMGWCISCHREEKVKVMGDETDYTVEDMGGLDCARCHY
ncbi:cytochrome c3 family protein [Pontibacter sp. G13]|uniref:cytochrome c3 family protein n=1 Tax=Pontibacter sp. G13 TaxID=3074898 RepID=UPI00288AEE94|nr:cytochrome c3 family protein [Pontibacter sp. G13]WNJ16598.1 cytochrome c3 family protein [Pontibacter sp. G13]